MDELREYPRLIHEAEQKAEGLREMWNREKVKRDYAFSRAFLKSKLSGTPEQAAKHQATQEVYEIDAALVGAESAYRKAASDYTYLDNRFTAARKIANMQETALMKLGAFE